VSRGGDPDTPLSEEPEWYQSYERRRTDLLSLATELPASMDIGIGKTFGRALPPPREDSLGELLRAKVQIEEALEEILEIKHRLGLFVAKETHERDPYFNRMDDEVFLEDEIGEAISHAGHRAIHGQANLDPLRVFELIR
jgi:hypothetical protein